RPCRRESRLPALLGTRGHARSSGGSSPSARRSSASAASASGGIAEAPHAPLWPLRFQRASFRLPSHHVPSFPLRASPDWEYGINASEGRQRQRASDAERPGSPAGGLGVGSPDSSPTADATPRVRET